MVVKHKHPVEMLPVEMREQKHGNKVPAADLVSMRVDYRSESWLVTARIPQRKMGKPKVFGWTGTQSSKGC